MKPHRIILIRHGECHANTDESKFATEPDYTIELTEKGIAQAKEAGEKLKTIIGEESMYFYISPFWRTRSTFEQIARSFPRKQFRFNEEPRLREQEWGYTGYPPVRDALVSLNNRGIRTNGSPQKRRTRNL